MVDFPKPAPDPLLAPSSLKKSSLHSWGLMENKTTLIPPAPMFDSWTGINRNNENYIVQIEMSSTHTETLLPIIFSCF